MAFYAGMVTMRRGGRSTTIEHACGPAWPEAFKLRAEWWNAASP